METMLLERPVAGASLLPPTSRAVALRVHAFAGAIGGLVDTTAAARDPMFAGSVVMPYAGLVVAGTACRRPLIFREGDAVARHSRLDLGLLRFDAERGVTFDIRLQQRSEWLCHYVAWRRDGDLWLVPEVGTGPFIRVTAWGLEIEDEPPFVLADERASGIVRARTIPSFMGRI
ncbi:hypothetical protein [Novosphingobium sp. M1R2S20]|uniref:Uncharacterized protein n=1 Tax=Novosphingobium rhizovicinum TaxID=3228928 RepID=A0ABV3R7J5_9SPHN